MIRLLGAITGSALALAALLVLVGVPQFKAQPEDNRPAPATLPLRAEVLPSDQPEEAVAAATEVVSTTPEETVVADAVPAEEPVHEGAPETPTAEEQPRFPIEDLDEELVAELPVATPIDELGWYAFWSPFRSEIAADGFVTQLQRVTGLDYRVVKVKPGVYEVAFAYANDEDIPINLSQISAATGLDMPGN